MTINYKKYTDNVLSIIKEVGFEALDKIVIAASELLLKEAGMISAPKAKAIAQKAKEQVEAEDAEVTEEQEESPAPKKVAAKVAAPKAEKPEPKEGQSRVRSTDTEMVIKTTKQLADAKAAGAPKEKIAAIKLQHGKYVAKLKAAGKEIPTGDEESPAKEEKPAAKPAKKAEKEVPVEEGFASDEPEEKPAPSKKFAKAPAKKAGAWDGKVGGDELEVGDAVMLTDDGETYKYRVVEIDVDGSRVKAFPATTGKGDAALPSATGKLAKNEDDAPFQSMWIEIKSDGSNIVSAKEAV